jgi:hemerythrin-like metal-binding protein
MELREWADGLDVGVEAIDSEHRLQIDLLGALESALREGRAQEAAGEILQKLLDYTNVHFLAEDLMMRLYAYPAYGPHALEHGRLAEQLAEASRVFGGGDHAVTLELIAALKHWLVSHIRGMDQPFAAWLKKTEGGA